MQTANSLRLLYIEDDLESAPAVVADFESIGMSVQHTDEVDEASEYFLNNEVDAVVVDLEVRKGGVKWKDAGAEFVEDLRSGKLGESQQLVPVVLHSAYIDESHEVRKRFEGVSIVTKPAEPVTTLSEVTRPDEESRVLIEVHPLWSSTADLQLTAVIPSWSADPFGLPVATVESYLDLLVAAEDPVYFEATIYPRAHHARWLSVRDFETIELDTENLWLG